MKHFFTLFLIFIAFSSWVNVSLSQEVIKVAVDETQTGEFTIEVDFKDEEGDPIPVTFTTNEVEITSENATLAGVEELANKESTYRVTITPDNDIQDTTVVILMTAESDDYTIDPTEYTVPVDTRHPSVESIEVLENFQDGKLSFDATITFSEDVAGFTDPNAILANASTAIATVMVEGSGTEHTATITPSTGGTISIIVPADTVTDLIKIDRDGNQVPGNGNIEYDDDSVIVVVPDEVLNEGIKLGSAPITQDDMEKLVNLEVRGHSSDLNERITDLTGLEHATNLTELSLVLNSIENLSPIAGLTNLTKLSFGTNSVTDISVLANLTSLTDLAFTSNFVTDITALTNLTSLTDLEFSRNEVTDISALANLTSLTFLDISSNRFESIEPLAGLVELITLDLFPNALIANTDLSLLAWLPKLVYSYKPLAVKIEGVPEETQSAPFSVTITFSEAVTDFEIGDVKLSLSPEGIATVTETGLTDPTFIEGGAWAKYVAEVTPTKDGTLTIQVPADVATYNDSDNNAKQNTESGAHEVQIDVNDPPVFATDTATLSVEENTEAGEGIGTALTATDPDSGDTLSYTLGGTDASSFDIVSETGQLQTKGPLDYETTTSYQVTITVSDGNGGEDTITVTIEVEDLSSLIDGRTLQVKAAIISAAKVDFEEDLTEDNLAEINYLELQEKGITGLKDIDFNSLTGLARLHLNDNQLSELPDNIFAQNTGLTRLHLNNNQLSELPDSIFAQNTELTFLYLNNNQLSEWPDSIFDGPNALNVLEMQGNPNEDSPPFQLSVSLEKVEDAEGQFKVVIPDRAPFQFQFGAGVYDIDFTVTNGNLSGNNIPEIGDVVLSSGGVESVAYTVTRTQGTTEPVTVGISLGAIPVSHEGYELVKGSDDLRLPLTVIKANEAPVFTEGASTTREIAENTAEDIDIGETIAATDADGDTLTYSLGGTDAASFSIDGATGQLGTITGVNLDHETKPSYSVTITASDGKLTDTINVTINVTDVDEIRPVPTIKVPEGVQNSAFDVTITFNESVTSFDDPVKDITFTGTASVTATLTGRGTTYTATIIPSAEGSLTIQVPAGAAQDTAKNGNTASDPHTVTIDLTRPTVESITVPADVQNSAFNITITFTEEVTGFDNPVKDIKFTGTATATVDELTQDEGDEKIYTAKIEPTKDGELTIQVPADATHDAANNGNTASSTHTVTIDQTDPTLTITNVPSEPQNGAFSVTITFSEAVTGLTSFDISLTGVTAMATLTGRGTTYTATITPSTEGSLTIQVPAGAAQDAAGNGNTASARTVTIDLTRPTVESITVPADVQNSAFDVTITFNEPVTGFEDADITLGGDAVVSTIVLSGEESEYTATITPDPNTDGDVIIAVPENVAEDTGTNKNLASLEQTVAVAPAWIPDANLRAVVREVLGMAEGEDFTQEDMFIEVLNAEDREITDISGLEYATELTELNLNYNTIEDITPLAALTQLNTLTLKGTSTTTLLRRDERFEDMSIFEALTLLTTLDLGTNQIDDITPLEYLTELAALDLRENAIEDITSLSNLTNLTTLYLQENGIDDLTALEDLTQLTSLDVSLNSVSDLQPLSGLAALTQLYLVNNAITDALPLTDLINLKVLRISENDIEDIKPLIGVAEDIEADVEIPTMIPDTALETGVRNILGLAEEVPLTKKVIQTLTAFDLQNNGISELNGLEYAINLTDLNLARNNIVTLVPLTDLTELKTLDLSHNDISDVTPLIGLENLEVLRLSGNPIADVSLLVQLLTSADVDIDVIGALVEIPDVSLAAAVRAALSLTADESITGVGLQNLTTLDAQNGNISDLGGLEYAINLTDLNLARNNIVTLGPLAGLTELKTVDLSHNSIVNLGPLTGLTKLTTVDLSHNDIVNLGPLTGLTKLTTLNLGSNMVIDIDPLSNLKELTTLDLSSNSKLKATPPSSLTKLDLEESTGISNLVPLSGLTKLTTLDLSSNNIGNLASVSGLTKLTTLELGDNNVAGISPLADLGKLTTLNLSRNNIGNISPLQELTLLSELYLTNNNIHDVAALAGLTALATLHLAENPVLDTTPLYPLTQLKPPVDIDIEVLQFPSWDVNMDGSVNEIDSALVTAAIGQTEAAIEDPRTDVNSDGTVDNNDLSLVMEHFNNGTSGAPSSRDLLTVLDPATLASLDQATLEAQLAILLAQSDGSLKYLRAIQLLRSFLAAFRPEETLLLANYPNPFNPETWIPYQLATAGKVRITIYDTQGKVVRRLDLGHQREGYYTNRSRAAYWDGRNTLGERVASGIYFYQLQTDDASYLRKLVILK